MNVLIKTIFILCILSNTVSKPKINKAEKTNNTILNFFINKELSTRNYQIVGVFDYIPTQPFKKDLKSIKTSSHLKDRYSEKTSFLYENNNLTNISYAVDRDNTLNFITFRYHLNYSSKNKLETIYIKDRLIFYFDYNSTGQLKLIKHFFKDGMTKIYNLSYKQEKINFSVDVIKKGEIYLDANDADYLLLNKDKKLVEYNFTGINSYYNIQKTEILKTSLITKLIPLIKMRNLFTLNLTKKTIG